MHTIDLKNDIVDLCSLGIVKFKRLIEEWAQEVEACKESWRFCAAEQMCCVCVCVCARVCVCEDQE